MSAKGSSTFSAGLAFGSPFALSTGGRAGAKNFGAPSDAGAEGGALAWAAPGPRSRWPTGRSSLWALRAAPFSPAQRPALFSPLYGLLRFGRCDGRLLLLRTRLRRGRGGGRSRRRINRALRGSPLAQGNGVPPVCRGVGGDDRRRHPRTRLDGDAAAWDAAPPDLAAANSPALVGGLSRLRRWGRSGRGARLLGRDRFGRGLRGRRLDGGRRGRRRLRRRGGGCGRSRGGRGQLNGRRRPRGRGRGCGRSRGGRGRLRGSWRGRRSRGLGGDLRRRFGRRRRPAQGEELPHRRARHEQRRSLAVLARRRRGAIDLRLEQNVVRPADHDQVFDIVPPDEHELALPVEAECVDQPEPRLSGPSARNAQPMSERQPVKNRQNDKDGDPASQKESDLQDPIVRERKVTQPLHAQSKTSAPSATNRSLNSPANDGFARARDVRSPAPQ